MDFSLYNIDPQEFRIIDRHEEDGNVTYDLEPIEEPESCPTCYSSSIKKHGTFQRSARDLSEYAKKVGLIIHTHRYKCQNCLSTWVPQFRSIDSNAKMTNRMRDYIRKQSLTVPFSRIKDELDISVSTIREIFKAYVDGLDSKRKIVAPRVLGIDENYLNNAYRCIYTDIENGLIIDLTPDRKDDTVKRWIATLPEKDRIECVTMDMWWHYRDDVHAELPGIPIVVDKFHVIKNLNDALDALRKSLKDDLTANERRHAKDNRWLLLHNNEDLDFMAEARLNDLLYSFPQFKEPYELKESFRNIYKAETREDAENRYSEWKEMALSYAPYRDFIDTVDNWYEEIFNYFDHHYTNAVTESLNNLCKEIAAIGRGYTFDVLRAKILYGTKATKPARYHYYKKEKPLSDIADTGCSDTIFRNGGIYEYVGAYMPTDNKKHRRIEVSSGTDIRMLAYLLRIKEFWE